MLEKMVKLRNTMMLVETRGESTKIMAGCLQFTDEIIEELTKKAVEKADTQSN